MTTAFSDGIVGLFLIAVGLFGVAMMLRCRGR